jgi:hypothetical protein
VGGWGGGWRWGDWGEEEVCPWGGGSSTRKGWRVALCTGEEVAIAGRTGVCRLRVQPWDRAHVRSVATWQGLCVCDAPTHPHHPCTCLRQNAHSGRFLTVALTPTPLAATAAMAFRPGPRPAPRYCPGPQRYIHAGQRAARAASGAVNAAVGGVCARRLRPCLGAADHTVSQGLSGG